MYVDAFFVPICKVFLLSITADPNSEKELGANPKNV